MWFSYLCAFSVVTGCSACRWLLASLFGKGGYLCVLVDNSLLGCCERFLCAFQFLFNLGFVGCKGSYLLILLGCKSSYLLFLLGCKSCQFLVLLCESCSRFISKSLRCVEFFLKSIILSLKVGEFLLCCSGFLLGIGHSLLVGVQLGFDRVEQWHIHECAFCIDLNLAFLDFTSSANQWVIFHINMSLVKIVVVILFRRWSGRWLLC